MNYFRIGQFGVYEQFTQVHPQLIPQNERVDFFLTRATGDNQGSSDVIFTANNILFVVLSGGTSFWSLRNKTILVMDAD